MTTSLRYVTGGAVAPESPCYVERKADQDLYNLCERGEFAYVLTSRQMGKSSLVARTMLALSTQGILVASIDLTEIGIRGVTADQWYLGLLTEIEDAAGPSDVDLFAWWKQHEELTCAQRFLRYLGTLILPNLHQQFVVFIDEIDSTIRLDFADDFFAALRSTHNSRATDAQFEKISFVLLGVATPAELIRDQSRTPFNIGTRVELVDFNESEAATLVEKLGRALGSTQEILGSIMHWTGGQPYLVQRACAALDLATDMRGQLADQFIRNAILSDGGKSDPHFQFVGQYLLATPDDLQDELFSTYYAVLRGQQIECRDSSPVHNRLRLAGVLKRQGPYLAVRNELYRSIFGREWVRKHRKKSWVVANRRILMALMGSVGLTIAFGWIAFVALRAQSDAQRNERNAQASEFAAAAQSELLVGDGGLGMLLARYALMADPDNPRTLASAHKAADLASGTLLVGSAAASWKLAALSPDGSRIATVADGSTAQLWNTETGESAGVLSGLGERPTVLVFSGDSRAVYLGGANGSGLVWDVRSSAMAFRLQRHPSRVIAAEFGPDAAYLVSTDADGRVAIFTPGPATVSPKEQDPVVPGVSSLTPMTLRKVIDAHAGPVRQIALARSGFAMCIGAANGRLHCWRGPGFIRSLSIKAHERPITSIGLSENGDVLLTAARGDGAKVWDARTGRLLLRVAGFRENLLLAILTKDGKTVVTGDDAGLLSVWNIESGQRVHSLQAHTAAIRRLALSGNDRRLISSGEDQLTRVWDLRTGRQLAQGPIVDSNSLVSTLDADGKKALSLSAAGSAMLWSIDRDLLVAESEAPRPNPRLTRLAFDGRSLVVEAPATLWIEDAGALAKGKPPDKFLLNPDWVEVGLDHKQGRLLIAGSDGHIDALVRDVGLIQLGKLEVVESRVRMARFSQDGKRVLVSFSRGAPALYETETGRLVARLDADTGEVTAMSFDTEGLRFATGSQTGSVRVWNASDGKQVAVSASHVSPVRNLAWFPSGDRILSVDAGGRALVSGALDGKTRYELSATRAQASVASLSPDGSLVLLAQIDSSAWIYDATRGTPVSTLRGHKGDIVATAFSAAGDRVITAGGDGRSFVWDVQTGLPLLELRGHAAAIADVRFAENGTTALTLDVEGRLRVWDVSRAQRSSAALADWLDRQLGLLKRTATPAECLALFAPPKVVRPPECAASAAGGVQDGKAAN